MHVEMTGTLNPDGTLTLDGKPALPSGPVRVRVEAVAAFVPPDTPFWWRMQAIWDGQKARGYVPPPTEELEAHLRELREVDDDRERLIDEAYADYVRRKAMEEGGG